MCQVLCGKFLLLEPRRKTGFDFIEGAFERAIGGVTIRQGGGKAWAQEPVVGAGKEQGSAQAKRGDAVAEAVGNFFDNPVKPQAAKLIGQSALGDIAGISAGQSGKVLAQIGGAKAVGLEAEENDGLPDELDARIGEA